ncbi:hypothetical protein LMG26411_02377 [Cupriavidus numazuensis]|uniref:Transposase n=1 Tax=Cupriavidus numazuensis TaxID=221992 RepID=A0ABM8TFS2_9BURK|nr:hypothetical protein LMG26411_02377 [Cupriavidus numazuensis]
MPVYPPAPGIECTGRPRLRLIVVYTLYMRKQILRLTDSTHSVHTKQDNPYICA